MAEETKQDAASSEKVAQDAKTDMRGMADQFEAFLDEHMVKNAPFHIPAGGKEFIVTVAPYLILVIGVATFILPLILSFLHASVLILFSPFGNPYGVMSWYYNLGIIGLMSRVLFLVALVIELSAVKGLFARTHASWRLLYYASLISLASSLVLFQIIGGIIGSIIGWYILFQVKSLYTK